MSTAFKRALSKKKTAEVSLFDDEKATIKTALDVEESDSSSDNDSQTSKQEKIKSIKVDQAPEEELDEEHQLRAFKDADPNSKEWKNRQRTLVLCARGVNSRFRHLMNDIMDLLPHCKKESKIERKIAKDYINDLCYQRSCNNCIFLESRKRKDFFLWVMKSPEGPSIKFAVQNINTMDELKMTGNCLKYSRPLLSFDSSFNSEPHL